VPLHDQTEPPLYRGLLSDVLAAARAEADEARGRAVLAEQLAEQVAGLHRRGADGLCGGCGLVSPCPTERILAGELGPADAAATARRLLADLAASRILEAPADDEQDEPRPAGRASDGGPGRGSVPSVPSMADLLAPNPGVGNFLDTLIPRNP
jgi:hypothetical protein